MDLHHGELKTLVYTKSSTMPKIHSRISSLERKPQRKPSLRSRVIRMSDNQNWYTYVIIRKDISLVQQIVQASHAALEAGHKFPTTPTTSYLILLEVENEHELLKAKKHLDHYLIPNELFHEPDNDLGFSAVCTIAIKGSKRKLLSRFKLYEE